MIEMEQKTFDIFEKVTTELNDVQIESLIEGLRGYLYE